MATSTQKSKAAPSAEKKAATNVAKKAASAQRSPKPEATKPPAYMQAKLAVSHPQDSAEKEADHIARQVAHSPKATPAPLIQSNEKKAQRASLEPVINADKGDTLALKPVAAAETIQRRPVPDNSAESQLDKQEPAPGKKGTTLQRQATDPLAGENTSSDTENRIAARRGTGAPLPAAVETEMSAKFNHDFSAVRIHTDKEAADLCAETHARAFTVGNDIFFAPGEFAPESDAGRELLAHELTHVVQQGGNTLHRIPTGSTGGTATPAPAATAGGGVASANTLSVTSGEYSGTTICTDAGSRSLSLPKLKLPALKQRNAGLFPKPLEVRQGSRPNTNQTSNFRTAVSSSVQSKLTDLTTQAHAQGAVGTDPGSSTETFFFTLNNNPQFMLFGTTETLLPRLEIPIWDPQGQPTSFQVDHIREMQLNGDDSEGNYELLEGGANMGAGRAIAKELGDTIKGGLDALKTANPTATLPASTRWRNVKDTYRVSFQDFTWNLSHDDSANGSRFWKTDDIKNGTHTTQLRPMQASERTALGAAGEPAIYPSAQGGVALPSVSAPRNNWITRVDLISWTAAPNPTGDALGTLTVDVFKGGSAVATAPGYPSQAWAVRRIPGLNAGYIDQNSVSMGVRNSLRLPGMSPIELDQITLSASGIAADGRVLPTVPLIGDADIRIRINGDEAQVYKTFSMEEITLPAPLRMDSCDLTVFYGSSSGLGIEGRAEFGINQVGNGFLGAAASTRGGFALEGGFDFDSQLFDQAHIEMWYRNDQFGALGDLAITSPNKIRGIRSANVHMAYEEGSFNATGTVEPNIPGVQQAGLRITCNNEGLVIGGTLQLAPNPAIRSGSIDVTVQKQGEEWKVAATGSAQPAIPGIDSQLTVGYDDGAFTAEFSGAYARGMLSGNATVGVTNRSVAEDGTATGEAAPDAPLIVYGNGSATLQIAPWLRGTAGIHFAPNGEVTVIGEIGLPDSLEIFSVKEINKQLFGLSTQIPIFPGIVAEVGGNLSAHASIGPGALDQCRIGIEYNPAHEENTHITGDAHLNIPSEAGLRLGARAGIGLGITGASATGGIELGGTLGISGAAEASVHIDWMPTTGLSINAEGYLHAEPKFKFDVSGYVAVTALGFSVYDNSWELAAYELGSNMTFGVRFPIHYQEGEPFNVSLNDVQFEVPDVDPAAMVRQLGDRIF